MARVDPVRYKLDNAVRESVEVVNRDGSAGLWIEIVRPRTSGARVPVILQATPYSDHTGTFESGGLGRSMYNAEYFVPRGYAVAIMDVRGTGLSTGCQLVGSREEVRDAVDVVDWLAEQKWSNGRIGMTGPSYDGSIANGAAVEQVLTGRHPDALRAVIPMKAIGRWYDHLYNNGVPLFTGMGVPAIFNALGAIDPHVAATPREASLAAERRVCAGTATARRTATYAMPLPDADNEIFSGGDYIKNAQHARAAFFLIHGMFDFNVHPTHPLNVWTSLPQSAPKKLWLYNGEHSNPYAKSADETNGFLSFPFRDAYFTAAHRWWAQHLKDLQAGAYMTPTVEVQGGDGNWRGSRRWPLVDGHKRLHLRADRLMGPTSGEAGVVTWTDTPPDLASPSKQVFLTSAFSKATRLSGQVLFDLSYTLQGPDTTVEAHIELLPPAVPDGAGPDPFFDREETGALTLGYAYSRAAYRETIASRGVSTPRAARHVAPGERVRTAFGSTPVDVMVPARGRLRITFSAGGPVVIPSATGGQVSLQVGAAGSTVSLPVSR